jgi:isocitrate lyase
MDGSSIVAEVKSSWTGVRKADIAALGEIAMRLRPDVALLAVMDRGRAHEEALKALEIELSAAGMKFQLITLDTHPLDDEPYLW